MLHPAPPDLLALFIEEININYIELRVERVKREHMGQYADILVKYILSLSIYSNIRRYIG